MITLICGHPRAGKTTYSKRFDGICKVIHLDEAGSHINVIKRVRSCDEDVVVEGVYYDPGHRRELLAAYRGVGSRCICLDTSLAVREQRLGYKLRHDHPFLIPTRDEGWDEIIVIGDNYVEGISNEKQA